jgi:S1-C subfamily serine protease
VRPTTENIVKTRALFALLLLLAIGAASHQTQSAPGQLKRLEDYQQLEARIQGVVDQVRPAVVGIRMSRSSGSGCFISEDGWVATCGHVTGTAVGTRCKVVLHGGETLDAVTAGWHEAMDFALVKADTKGQKVKYCALGESENVKPGDWLIPMGHPLGAEGGRDAVVRAGRCLVPENARRRA